MARQRVPPTAAPEKPPPPAEFFLVPIELLQGTYGYLMQRPANEVLELLDGLRACLSLDAKLPADVKARVTEAIAS